jgi:hypothetical protein
LCIKVKTTTIFSLAKKAKLQPPGHEGHKAVTTKEHEEDTTKFFDRITG